MSTRSIRAAAVVAATAAALLLAGCSPAPIQRPVAAVGTPVAAAGDSTPSEVVAIGDSIAFGKGVRPDQAWPALVADAQNWHLTDLAVSGSGFVHKGWNGTTFRQQVDQALRLRPDYILIAATRNDRDDDPAAVERACTQLLGELREAFPHARIIGTTAIWGSDTPPASVERVDAIAETAVTDVGGSFLDVGFPLVGHPEWLQPDGIHPNALGQDVVAKVVEAKLAPLDLAL
ncbi:SGNH/GDSL hydrolase family protein [Leifsonia sp. NPDC058292]|uniref:SGNH/GDSL hydrolase family protein n=1 Tax=Leifsonia sp. NPDC058292 TaxID=3346428 RepID=UPI0036DD7F80